MELKTNSWHSKLYNYSYMSSLPNNLCSYFWKVIFAMILFPLSLPVGLFSFMKNQDISLKIFFNILFSEIALLLGIAIIYLPLQGEFKGLIYISLMLLAFSLFIISLYIIDYIKEKREYRTKKPNIFIEYIKAKKENYCSKITWK